MGAALRFQNHKTNSTFQFAKHMKIEEQISFLGKSRAGIGVGTPARLAELIENGR